MLYTPCECFLCFNFTPSFRVVQLRYIAIKFSKFDCFCDVANLNSVIRSVFVVVNLVLYITIFFLKYVLKSTWCSHEDIACGVSGSLLVSRLNVACFRHWCSTAKCCRKLGHEHSPTIPHFFKREREKERMNSNPWCYVSNIEAAIQNKFEFFLLKNLLWELNRD